jgi:hypothetical protein
LSREDPGYKEYLRDVRFVELQGTVDEPVIVSSCSSSDTEDKNERETEEESSPSLDSSEEEKMLRQLRKETCDRAKAIMRSGSKAKRRKQAELESDSSTNSSPVQQKRHMQKKRVQAMSTDDDVSEENTIPPSPYTAVRRLFHQPDSLPQRNPISLRGEQSTPKLWGESCKGTTLEGVRSVRDTSTRKCSSPEEVSLEHDGENCEGKQWRIFCC